jgi:hypothetical protein
MRWEWFANDRRRRKPQEKSLSVQQQKPLERKYIKTSFDVDNSVPKWRSEMLPF